MTEDGGSIHDLENGLKAKLILKNKTLNVAQFGMRGDDNTDYTEKLNKIATFLQNNDVEIVNFNKGEYKVSNIVEFNLKNRRNFTIDFGGGSILLTKSFNYYYKGIFTFIFDKSKNAKITIKNGFFNGVGNPTNFSSTNVHPIGGRGMFFIDGARNLEADNCYFENWFYSACFWTHYLDKAEISNCYGFNVGGRSADNTEDARGDALYFGMLGVHYCYDENGFVKYLDEEENIYWYDEEQAILYDNTYEVSSKGIANLSIDIKSDSVECDIVVKNCSFKSYKACENMYPKDTKIRNGCKSGRCGIVFGEFSITGKKKHLNIKNTTFYNYQRTIHIENVDEVDVTCENVSFEEYGSAILTDNLKHWNSILCKNCTFKKDIDVIGISSDYNAIISASPEDRENQLKFDTCRFIGKNVRLALHMNSTKINMVNSYLETELLTSLNNCEIIFERCTIKYNQTNLFKTIIKIKDSEVFGGYLNNADSIYYLGTNDFSETDLKNPEIVLENSRINNSSVYLTKNAKLNLINNIFNYDENYKTKNNVNNSPSYLFNTYGIDVGKVIGNTFNIKNSNVKQLVDSSFKPFNNTTLEIKNNIFNNIGISIYSAKSQNFITQKTLINVTDNTFNNTAGNTNKGLQLNGDNFGNMINGYVANNTFNGYESPMLLQDSVAKVNNYNITSAGMVAL